MKIFKATVLILTVFFFVSCLSFENKRSDMAQRINYLPSDHSVYLFVNVFDNQKIVSRLMKQVYSNLSLRTIVLPRTRYIAVSFSSFEIDKADFSILLSGDFSQKFVLLMIRTLKTFKEVEGTSNCWYSEKDQLYLYLIEENYLLASTRLPSFNLPPLDLSIQDNGVFSLRNLTSVEGISVLIKDTSFFAQNASSSILSQIASLIFLAEGEEIHYRINATIDCGEEKRARLLRPLLRLYLQKAYSNANPGLTINLDVQVDGQFLVVSKTVVEKRRFLKMIFGLLSQVQS